MARISPESVFAWISRGLGGIVNMIVIEVEEKTPVTETELELLKGHIWRLQEGVKLLDPDWDGSYNPILTPKMDAPNGQEEGEENAESDAVE